MHHDPAPPALARERVPSRRRTAADGVRAVRMVATDIDGTIVPHGGTVSTRTVAALEAFARAGGVVVYATGRPPRWLTPVLEATGHQGLAVCANGSVVVDARTASVSVLHTVPTDAAWEVLGRLRAEFPDVALGMETTAGFVAEESYWAARAATAPAEGLVPAAPRRRAEAVHRLDDELDGAEILKLVALSPSFDADTFLATAGRQVGDLVTPTHSTVGASLLEMSPLGVTKASTLAELAHSWGIAREEVVAFGDMPNDVAMLQWAGAGYAMAGGHPGAVGAAAHLAPPAVEDGVAQVLERILTTGTVTGATPPARL